MLTARREKDWVGAGSAEGEGIIRVGASGGCARRPGSCGRKWREAWTVSPSSGVSGAVTESGCRWRPDSQPARGGGGGGSGPDRSRHQRAKGLEKRLWHAQRVLALGQLTGGVAHEFSNLLSVILGYGGFVVEALEAGHPCRADLQEMMARRAGHGAGGPVVERGQSADRFPGAPGPEPGGGEADPDAGSQLWAKA